MLLPLYMLIGKFGDIKKPQSLYRFFLYNLLGAVIMFVAVVMIFDFQSGMELSRVRALPMQTPVQYFIWGGVFVSFLFRIPVWPFHYWISVIGSGVKNPLVFLVVNLLPLTGVYGFVRFLPQTLPDGAAYYILALEIISVVTMLFIALIAFINKDFQYKMFAYLTVYYIMYLLGVLSRTELILFNIGFSFFSFLIIVAMLEVVSQYIHFQQENLDIGCEGLLCATPRLSFIYSFFILAAVGLPLSSLFMNNFFTDSAGRNSAGNALSPQGSQQILRRSNLRAGYFDAGLCFRFICGFCSANVVYPPAVVCCRGVGEKRCRRKTGYLYCLMLCCCYRCR